MKKQCTKCGKMLDHSEFNKNKNRKDGLQIWCKGCASKYQKEKQTSLKLEAINAFGGRCIHIENGVQCPKNSINDLVDLDLMHPNGDGDKHRDLISNGQTGSPFYKALQKLGYDTGKFIVKVMCKTHHCSFDKSGKKNYQYVRHGKLHPGYKQGKFNNPVWLRKRYIDDKMSTRSIAKECGVGPGLILDRMIEFNVSRRNVYGKGKLNSLYKQGKFNDPIWLKEKYKTMTAQAIADKCKVSLGLIRRRFIEFNIQRRKQGRGKLNSNYKDGKFNDLVWLKKKYETMSLQEIADECRVDVETIRNRMKKFGIPRRKPGCRVK